MNRKLKKLPRWPHGRFYSDDGVQFSREEILERSEGAVTFKAPTRTWGIEWLVQSEEVCRFKVYFLQGAPLGQWPSRFCADSPFFFLRLNMKRWELFNADFIELVEPTLIEEIERLARWVR